MALHPDEDIDENSALYFTIRRYHRYGIYKRFGLNLTEFLALPRDYVTLLFKIAWEDVLAKKPELDDLETRLDDLT